MLTSARIFRFLVIGRPYFRFALILAAAIVAIGVAYGTTVAAGADAYGYVSQADLWRHGRLLVDQPWAASAPWPDRLWTFSPLGYRPHHDEWAIVPTYSPGLPMLMAVAQLVGGHSAGFLIVPLSGGVLVLAAYGLGRRLGSPRVGLWAAWLVATSPAVIYMLMAPMTDVPVAAAWAVAIYFVLAGPSLGAAFAAGLSTSIAILIRPNLAPAAAILAGWYLIRWSQGASGGGRRQAIRDGLIFIGAVVPSAVAVGWINHDLYGSAFRSGYGELGSQFQLSHILPNIKQYVGWLIDTQTPLVLAGFLALYVPARALWPRVPARIALLVPALFVLFVWAQYCYYQVFDVWWYLRFLLPSWPFIMIGVASVAEAGFSAGRRWLVVGVTSLLVAIGGYGIYIAQARFAFDEWRGEARYVTAARMVQGATAPNSVILAMQQSGSVRYYGGRLSLRYDWLNERWLDRALRWLIAHGAHPYALLDEWEVPKFQARFGELSEVGRLQMKPMMIYKGSSTMYLYDLAGVPLLQGEPDVVNEVWSHVRYATPVPAPKLVLEK